MNLSAKYSKTGKGVQEASGKTSHLSRGDRAVLSAIDGKSSLADVQKQFEKLAGPKFEALIQQLDKDGFIREIAGAAAPEPISPLRKPATPPAAAKAPPKAAGPSADLSDGLDFTQAVKMPSKAPAAPAPPKAPVDLAAASRAEAERKAKEQAAVDFRGRQEAEAKASAEAKAKAEFEAKARAATEAKARADAESKARAEAEAAARAAAEAKGKADAEAKARAEAETRARADAEAKSKAARDMALRMAAEAKAKAEAESKDKARLEAELNAKLDEERKAREEAEKRAAEAADRARKELEEKAKRDADELRQKLEAEMKAKLEEERRLREEEDRKRREEDDRRRKEEDERRAKEDAERRAREEADRKRREEEDRKRREDDERRRKEEDERRAKEESERRAREDADRKRREEEDRRRKEEDERRGREDAERKTRDEAERKARDETDRKARDDADRKAREDSDRKAKEESDRRAKEEAERKAAAAAPAPSAPPAAAPAAAGGDFGSLLSDLDSFGQKEEEELKAKQEAERKEKEAAAKRAREEEERQRREAEEKKRREQEERRAKEEAERKAKEEEERKAKEEEEQRNAEEEERKRKAKEALARKQAAEQAASAKESPKATKPKAKADDDIGVSDDDLDMDDVKRDEKAVSKEARLAVKEREQVAVVKAKRSVSWGKPAAIALFVILAGGVGALHIMPLSTAEYEKAASEAFGAPVKVASARLSVITGVQVNLEGVTVGDAKFRLARGYPEIGSLFGAKKSFTRIELEGASLSQAQLGEALFGKGGGDNFRVGRIVVKQVKLEGPLTLPALDIEAVVGGDGSLQTVTISGPDKLSLRLTPRGNEVGFEASAGSVTIPFVPAMTLSDFSWKGTATRQGIASSEFDGRQFDGLFSGTARVRWGPTWTVDGEIRTRGSKVAVFAPTLVSEGKVEGRGNFTMSGPNPAKLSESARLEGSFKIESGVIGNFALRRALETGGAQTTGRTEFSELTGQGVYDKGAVQLRNLSIVAGAMNASTTLDIDPGGALAGRISAEVKTPNQTLRAVLSISGSLQNPVVRK